ncbi:hypothetical protein LTR37_008427 [Vermiconidia calcicola]|uniref:Uncharacterized protein n=1 Tax=Vermiconidia calcicola TaxID=1690605 RepID=A0ACC3NB64_9PEZI|nr:hypothetical protein LTR37_008427 [Vermiconidia calcicola]
MFEQHASPDVHKVLVPFVTQAILEGEQDVLDDGDLDALQNVIGEFQSPSGDHTAEGIVLLHWPPGPTPDSTPEATPDPTPEPTPDPDVIVIDSSDNDDRAPPLTIKKRRFDRAAPTQPKPSKRPRLVGTTARPPRISRLRRQHPFKPCGPTFDLGSETMNTLKALSIVDANGKRLEGAAPYKDDPAIAYHFAHARVQILDAVKAGNVRWILLCGRSVERRFVKDFGKYSSGKQKKIGDRMIYVFYIPHPEHIKRYANAKCLRDTLTTLRKMKQLCGVDVGDEWLCDMIDKRGDGQEEEDVGGGFADTSAEAAKNAEKTIRSGMSTSERLLAYYASPAGQKMRENLSKIKKESWTGERGEERRRKRQEWLKTPAGIASQEANRIRRGDRSRKMFDITTVEGRANRQKHGEKVGAMTQARNDITTTSGMAFRQNHSVKRRGVRKNKDGEFTAVAKVNAMTLAELETSRSKAMTWLGHDPTQFGLPKVKGTGMKFKITPQALKVLRRE